MRRWVWDECKALMKVGKMRYVMNDPNQEDLPKKDDLKTFGTKKGGKVRVVIIDFWMYQCLAGKDKAPLDEPNRAPDLLIGAKAFQAVEKLKAFVSALAEFYPGLEKVGLVRRDDGDDACWTAMRFLPRATKRLGLTLNVVDVSMPKAANGDIMAIPPGFDKNFH